MARAQHPRSSTVHSDSNARARQPETVTGQDNRWLKRFRAALAGRMEAGEGAIGIEGARLVEEALFSAIPIEAILVSEAGRKHLSRFGSRFDNATKLLATTDALFARLSGTETPQGIAALVRPPRASFDDLLRGPVTNDERTPLIVVLVGLQDPGNVGTILRAAEALGATGVAACRTESLSTAHLFSPKVVRASAGAIFRLRVTEGVSTAILQAQLRVAGVRTVAATSALNATDPVPPWDTNLVGPIALLIGNEGSGLPRELEASADLRVRIPLAMVRGAGGESVESLNAASAAAILLYEAARQRSAVSVKLKTASTRHTTANS